MDATEVLIFIGLVLCGVIIAAPLAFALGQRSVLRTVCRVSDVSVLDADVLEEKR